MNNCFTTSRNSLKTATGGNLNLLGMCKVLSDRIDVNTLVLLQNLLLNRNQWKNSIYQESSLRHIFICFFLKICRWVFSVFGFDRWNGTFETLLPFFRSFRLVLVFVSAFVRNSQSSSPFIPSFVLCFVWPCSFEFRLV